MLKIRILRNGGFSMLVSIIMTIILVSCTIAPSPDYQGAGTNPTQNEVNDTMADTFRPKMGEVIASYLSKENFQKFLKEPSTKKFTEFTIFEKSGYIDISRDTSIPPKIKTEGGIKQKGVLLDGTTIKEETARSGLFRVGAWPIYTEFIDFMSDPENFRKILSEHGIDEKMLSYMMIEYDYLEFKEGELIPPGTEPRMCIWIHTDAGDYFLEDNPYLAEDALDTNFTYDFYDLVGYSKKYGDK